MKNSGRTWHYRSKIRRNKDQKKEKKAKIYESDEQQQGAVGTVANGTVATGCSIGNSEFPYGIAKFSQSQRNFRYAIFSL